MNIKLKKLTLKEYLKEPLNDRTKGFCGCYHTELELCNIISLKVGGGIKTQIKVLKKLLPFEKAEVYRISNKHEVLYIMYHD